ncbi:hypothetical protein [Arsenophonus sp. PmNCSU2021_1]|uniref:hypothetical protein n=1 Tax=Arsenophonus sp. PmNCSU2021_1 TaxID=3118989 RepID=UPI002FEF1C38
MAPKTPVSGDTIIITEGIFEGLKAILFRNLMVKIVQFILLNILNQNVAKLIDNKTI